MPTTKKMKPTQPAAEPKAAPAAAQKPPSLTALLMACFEFDAEADDESRQLLLDTFEYWNSHDRAYNFNVVMASKALRSLGVHIGVDGLEIPRFLELLNLFAKAVPCDERGGGLREQLISRFLNDYFQDLTFDQAVAIIALEFQQKNTDIGCARQALEQYPEELADSIKKAMEANPKLLELINAS